MQYVKRRYYSIDLWFTSLYITRNVRHLRYFILKLGASFATDIYGIGAVFFELTQGKPPYYNPDVRKMFDNIRSAKLYYYNDIPKNAYNFI